MKQLLSLLFLLSSQASLAANFLPCFLSGQEILDKATEIKSQHSEFPEAYMNQIELSMNLSNLGSSYSGVVEGFYRPIKTQTFSVIPETIIGVELNKKSHLVYVCAQVDSDKNYAIDIFFLGHKPHMDEIIPVFNSLLLSDQVRISPLQIRVLNIDSGTDNKIINFLKMLFLPIYLQLKLFNQFANIFTGAFGVSIERVRIMNNIVEVSGGINMKNPDQPRFFKRIDLKSKEAEIIKAD